MSKIGNSLCLCLDVGRLRFGYACIPMHHPNSREFPQKKNERSLCSPNTYEFWAVSFHWAVCVHFRFHSYFFLSVYPLNCRRNWCAFMFIGCGMPEVSRKKATKHHSVHRMESRRSKKCVYLLFKNDLWCLYGANSVCLVRFLFAYFMHTTRLKWTRERKKGCYICKQFGILILNRSWLIHGKCFCHFCYCKSVTMRQNGIIYLHIGRLQSSLKRKNPRMCPFKL